MVLYGTCTICYFSQWVVSLLNRAVPIAWQVILPPVRSEEALWLLVSYSLLSEVGMVRLVHVPSQFAIHYLEIYRSISCITHFGHIFVVLFIDTIAGGSCRCDGIADSWSWRCVLVTVLTELLNRTFSSLFASILPVVCLYMHGIIEYGICIGLIVVNMLQW